ncbi:type I-E CRISPR-associated protein Cse1/CasA [Corynebacterium auriscanis]|uniref:CRISPR-associated protein n=1 Tax=Corynebacterium auriscanis TaxID=99807 RepID=A0A0A2DN92_9CORY|nr:type I-E CRISPR-associated protein Cse1/CasA [Corynebacterium auriscanis]KGM18346.1 CRISPR-associated protein [Corynebacterium auriscanis]WJY73769.1 CRISPR-associated protein Cse1 [Corynebacterium auriscanis]
MSDSQTFNLLNEPWILCMDESGAQHALSIRDVFSGHGAAYRVVGDSPTQDYAIIRLLMVIFWRAHAHDLAQQLRTRREREEFTWGEWFANMRALVVETRRDDVVLEYLKTVENRFDLLSPIEPFMQVGDLHTAKHEHKPVTALVPEAAGSFFTMRTGIGRESLSLAEAARWLVHLQAYDFSGIKSGAVGDARVTGGRGYPIGTGWTGRTGGTLILGSKGVLETLVLNTVPQAVIDTKSNGAVDGDKPVWERATDTASQRPGGDEKLGVVPTGASDLATWQIRRVRLVVEQGRVIGTVVCNGDRIPDAGRNVMDDPHTPYRFSANQSRPGKPAYYARPYDPTRTVWRALDALIAVEGDSGFDDKKNMAPKRPENLTNLATLRADKYVQEEVFDVALISMEYGSNDSLVASTFSATIGMPLLILRDDDTGRLARQAVRDAAECTRAAAISLGWFVGQLHVAAGGEYEFGVTETDRFYAQMEPHFLNWMVELGSNSGSKIEEGLNALQLVWQHRLRHAVLEMAKELIRGAGHKALVGREVKVDEDTMRVISAGSLYRHLEHRLGKDLPLTHKTLKEAHDDTIK